MRLEAPSQASIAAHPQKPDRISARLCAGVTPPSAIARTPANGIEIGGGEGSVLLFSQ